MSVCRYLSLGMRPHTTLALDFIIKDENFQGRESVHQKYDFFKGYYLEIKREMSEVTGWIHSVIKPMRMCTYS